jgi:UDPglucose 6-dehydrogenase
MQIGIIGNGFVGKATAILEGPNVQLRIFDKNPLLCSPPGLKINDLLSSDIIFLSVPTPMNADKSCDLSIVTKVVHELDDLGYEGFKVIRSTVPVGTSDSLGCYFMPEFLTEQNYLQDFRQNSNWIFGKPDNFDSSFENKINQLFEYAKTNNNIVSSKTTFMTNKEAEMVKLFRNCFLATKVSFCNEIYEFCQLKNIDYHAMKSVACNDDRITTSHSNVPGPDGYFGFGGTCFPKDTASLLFQMQKENQKSFVIQSIIERNDTVDRPEKDWKNNKGRAVNF